MFGDEREIRRGRAKHGTTHFHCYATVYVIVKNKRYTLALIYVWGDERVVEVLKKLLARLKKAEDFEYDLRDIQIPR